MATPAPHSASARANSEQSTPPPPVITSDELEDALLFEVSLYEDTVIITKPYQLKQIILYVRDGGSLTDFHGVSEYSTNGRGAYFLQYPSDESAKEAYELYSADPSIQYVTVNTVAAPEAIPERWGAARIGADGFIEYLAKNGKTGEELIIAQIDTGVDASHDHFKGRLVPGYSFFGDSGDTGDKHGHGTHVAGIIVDTSPPCVKLMPIKSLDDNGLFYNHFTISNGIKYAVDNGAKVINLSMNGLCENDNCLHLQAIEYAYNNGVVSVAAAGNKAMDASGFCPSKSGHARTVAATDRENEITAISNYGASVDLSAPGDKIVSSIPGNKYASMSGTSLSAAYVSASSAMLMLEYPNYSPQKIKNKIKATTSEYAGSYFYSFGAGILDFDKYTVDVDDPPAVKLNKNAIKIDTINDKYVLHSLKATVTPDDIDNIAVTYTSDNPSVAVCDDGGRVEIKGNGKAVITAALDAYGVSDACEVTVGVDDSMFWIGAAAESFAGGDGSQDNPYKIANAGQLALMAKNGRYLAKGGGIADSEYFELTGDIDLGGKEWISLGYAKFHGHFDGNGHIIRNMRQSKISEDHDLFNLGLFDFIGGEVRNLGIENASVYASPGYSFMTGILSSTARGGVIENCYTTGESSGSGFIGIMAGMSDSDKAGEILRSSVKNCYSNAKAAGFIYAVSETDITNSYYHGEGNFVTQTHAGVPGVRASIINCFIDNDDAKTSYFVYTKGDAEIVKCYYRANGNAGIHFDASKPLTNLAARTAEFFRFPDNYAADGIWDARYPRDFKDVWGFDGEAVDGLPRLKFTAKPEERAAAPGFIATDVLYGKNVAIKSATAGADIYYTTDGSSPTGSGKLYTGSGLDFFEPGVITIRAVAVKEGMADSQIAGLRVTIEKVARPDASPPSGTVSEGAEVTLSSQTPNALIYYTADGTEPNEKSVKYAAPIKIDGAAVIRAVAYKPGMAASDAARFEYALSDSPIP
jgi:hypothetical protein